MSVKRVAIAVVCASFSAPLAMGDVMSLASVADNTLYENANGTTSNGSGTAMFAGRNSGSVGSIRRALVRFDLSQIPEGATITGATLRLSQSAANVGNANVRIFTVSQSWGEGASTASGGQGNGTAAAVGDATWLHRSFSSSLWSTPGGDFASSASAETVVSTPGIYEWSSEQFTADVAEFYANPGANFGWILIGDETAPSSAKRFATREDTNEGAGPELVVDFQIPSPTGATLAAVACLAGLRRRR